MTTKSSERSRDILGERSYKGSRFSIARAAGAQYKPGLRSFMEYRDLGLAQSTGGRFDGKVIKARRGHEERASWHKHELDFQLVYVLKGWITLEYEGVGRVTLYPGDCMHQAPGIHHIELDHSDDYEGIEIVSPGDFATREVEPPAEAETRTVET